MRSSLGALVWSRGCVLGVGGDAAAPPFRRSPLEKSITASCHSAGPLPNTHKKDDPLPLLYHFLSYPQFLAQNHHSPPASVWTHGGTTSGSPSAGRVSSPNALARPGLQWGGEREGGVCTAGGEPNPQEARRGQRLRTWSHQLRDENPGGEVPQREEPTVSPPSHHFSLLSVSLTILSFSIPLLPLCLPFSHLRRLEHPAFSWSPARTPRRSEPWGHRPRVPTRPPPCPALLASSLTQNSRLKPSSRYLMHRRPPRKRPMLQPQRRDREFPGRLLSAGSGGSRPGGGGALGAGGGAYGGGAEAGPAEGGRAPAGGVRGLQ